jgi:hypothetical protein
MRAILADLREGLKQESALRREFGDLAVDSHLEMMRGMANRDSLFKPAAHLDVPRDNNHQPLQPPQKDVENPIQPPRPA